MISDQTQAGNHKVPYENSLRIGWTMRSGEYDLMAPAAVGEHMT